MKNSPAGDPGFIKLIILIVAVLLLISYFGINLRELVNRPTTQDNITYVATTTASVWNNYLKVPATYVWKEVFIEMIWEPAIGNIKNSQQTTASSTSKSGL